MKYRFCLYDGYAAPLKKRTIATRSFDTPLSDIARTLQNLAFKRFGHAGYIVPNQTLVGGYYRNAAGDAIAVELDFT